jgi:hypothetical protein
MSPEAVNLIDVIAMCLLLGTGMWVDLAMEIGCDKGQNAGTPCCRIHGEAVERGSMDGE